MDDKTFNLLDKPWIRVIYPDCREDEVSLKQLFAGAHTYTDLSGELPTQNAAVLRLLLAVLHSVFYRVDEQGNPSEIESSDDAYDRWQALWEMGRFPTEPIDAYLENWRNRFDLLDDERPFYQVPRVTEITTDKRGHYTAEKLNGVLSKSNNKIRLFSSLAGEDKGYLSYAEAVRWLIHLNAYDDNSVKKSPEAKAIENENSIKLVSDVAWVGKLGVINAKGKNLFETLMLNFVLLNGDDLWKSSCPVWERDEVNSKERNRVAQPFDQAELLTLQSRKVILCSENGKINGYRVVNGDYFDSKNAFCEQMTVWQKRKDGNYYPSPHKRSRKMWQDFSSVAAIGEDTCAPGVVKWVKNLMENNVYSESLIRYQFVGARYDVPQSSSITDAFEDSLTFHLNLLTELNGQWIERITNEIVGCEKLAWAVGTLAKELDLAAGGNGSSSSERAKEQLYYRIDVPFRSWLLTLDANQSDVEREEKSVEWRNTAVQIADRLGQELIKQTGPAAFCGKSLKDDKSKDSQAFYCAPESYSSFKSKLLSYKKTESFKDENKNGGQ